MKMNPEIKSDWVKALRSGKYKQGRGLLRNDNDGYCCLGVLCDLHSKVYNVDWKPYEAIYGFQYDGCGGGLPESVAIWSNLPVSAKHNLTDMNDFSGANFEAIADYIEMWL